MESGEASHRVVISDLAARIRKSKARAARLAKDFVDTLSRRDRLRDELSRRPPAWWKEAEQAGQIMPWHLRVVDWQRRLTETERLIEIYETALTSLDEQLTTLLAAEAAADAREAHEEAIVMRGRKNGYARRLRPNLKPPLKQLGLGW